MKLHLPVRLFKALMVTISAAAYTLPAQAGVMHTDVTFQTYTDFGQNKGRYVTGQRVNDLLNYIRTDVDKGIKITYTDGTEPYIISNEQGMIDYNATDDIGAQVAVSPTFAATVLHNGAINASYSERTVGATHAINYESIDIRYSNVFRLSPNGYDYMLQRQGKLQTDVTWNPVTTVTDMSTLLGEHLYHSGAGSLSITGAATLQNVVVEAGSLSLSNTASSVEGNVSIGQGSTLTHAGGYTLGAGQTLAVTDTTSAGGAKFETELTVNDGRMVFSGDAMSESAAALQVNAVDSGNANTLTLSFTEEGCLQVGSKYWLVNGAWSTLDTDNITIADLQYLNGSVSTADNGNVQSYLNIDKNVHLVITGSLAGQDGAFSLSHWGTALRSNDLTNEVNLAGRLTSAAVISTHDNGGNINVLSGGELNLLSGLASNSSRSHEMTINVNSGGRKAIVSNALIDVMQNCKLVLSYVELTDTTRITDGEHAASFSTDMSVTLLYEGQEYDVYYRSNDAITAAETGEEGATGGTTTTFYAAVPEPGTATLSLLALAALAARRRRH